MPSGSLGIKSLAGRFGLLDGFRAPAAKSRVFRAGAGVDFPMPAAFALLACGFRDSYDELGSCGVDLQL